MYNANLLQISGVVARGADGLVVVLAKRGQVRPVDQCVVVRDGLLAGARRKPRVPRDHGGHGVEDRKAAWERVQRMQSRERVSLRATPKVMLSGRRVEGTNQGTSRSLHLLRKAKLLVGRGSGAAELGEPHRQAVPSVERLDVVHSARNVAPV